MLNLDKVSRVINLKISKRLIALLIIVLCFLFFFRSTRVIGASMEPSLVDGQRGISVINRFSLYTPNRGDLVIVRKASYSDKLLIKRVIGLPGDEIEIKDNVLYLNGSVLDEPYIKDGMITKDLQVNLGKGEIFILGDNRDDSADSRIPSIGNISYKKEVIGKFIFNLREFTFVK